MAATEVDIEALAAQISKLRNSDALQRIAEALQSARCSVALDDCLNALQELAGPGDLAFHFCKSYPLLFLSLKTTKALFLTCKLALS